MRKYVIVALVLLLSVLGVSPLFAVGKKELFRFKNDKKPDSVKLVKDESLLALRYESKLWVYDSTTGQQKWKTEVKGGIDDGLHMVWKDSLYLMPLKKGLTAFDLATGQQVWTADMEIKMKKYVEHFRVKDLLVIRFKDQVMVLRPDDGKVLWTAEFKFFDEAGVKIDYLVDGDWGNRLLLLGKKGPVLFELETGKILWQAKRDLSDEIMNPVLFAGDSKEMVVILYEKGASALNAKTGEEAWFIDDKIEDAAGLVRFEQAGGKYCLFGFKKTLVMFEAATGKILWKSAEKSDLKGRPYYTYPSGNDIMIITAHNTDDGGYVTAYKVKIDTGDVLGKADLVMSKKIHFDYKTPFFGRIRINYAWIWEPIQTPQGLLFQVWGMKTKKIKDDGKPGESEGEGLVMVDPETCKVKWRTYYKIHEEAADIYYPYFSVKSKTEAKNMTMTEVFKSAADTNNWDSPSSAELMATVAKPQVTDSAVYAAGNETIMKVDLNTGAILWQGPKVGVVSSLVAKENNVYGALGLSTWGYTTDTSSWKQGIYGVDVVISTKKNGYFCLDGTTGKEVWKTKVEKDPYAVFPIIHAKDESAAYVTDGRYLRQVAFSPSVKGFGWEIDMKKQDVGIISADEGVVFDETDRSFHDAGDHTTTTITYNSHMEHGIWQLENGDLFVIGSEGPARIAPDGKILWKKTTWDWFRKNITFSPKRLQNDKYLIYRFSDFIDCYDMETGKIKWNANGVGGEVILDSKEQKIIFHDGKDFSAYEI